MISRCKALIFDMDGTLIDSMGYWRRENIDFLIANNLPVPAEMRGREHLYNGRQSVELYNKTYHLNLSMDQYMRDRTQEMSSRYASGIPEKPGALNFIRQAHRRGYRMCVATATPTKDAIIALDKIGMTPYMEFVTSAEDVGEHKGDPRFFRAVAKKLGLPTNQCMVFEDALYAIKAAKRSGCHVYAIEEQTAQMDQHQIEMISDLYFHDYDELLGEL